MRDTLSRFEFKPLLHYLPNDEDLKHHLATSTDPYDYFREDNSDETWEKVVNMCQIWRTIVMANDKRIRLGEDVPLLLETNQPTAKDMRYLMSRIDERGVPAHKMPPRLSSLLPCAIT